MKIFKYNVVLIGCQMNVSDAERIKGILEDMGLVNSNERNEADVVIVTTCGVRQHAEDRIYGIIPRIKKHNPKSIIVLTGCLSKRQDVINRLNKHVDIWLNAKDMANLSQLLFEKLPTLKPQPKNIESLKNYLSLQPKYTSKYSAYVPIGNGCNNWCTYCVVPKARGSEAYRAPEEILNEVRGLIKNNYKEITLIAQNVDSYNFIDESNNSTSFATLLQQVDDLEGEYWLRFSTNHPKDISNDLVQVIKNGKRICPHIHLPVQSGDDEILKAMNRNYTKEEYLRLVDTIRINLDAELPATITTDIIVGYPQESLDQFNNTAQLMREVSFDMVYISQYSPRPNTASYNLNDNVTTEEKKRREDELTEILKTTNSANNRKYIGKNIRVLIIGNKKGYIIARTNTGKNVKIKIDNELNSKQIIGEFANVTIIDAESYKLYGKIIKSQ
ncbi:tRNA (N6-isopentenyl adenosine(37)-C2)-methylthiotransferase MiaB [Patescibacteria group bacterium]|nr:tRNA (N6-isopentenyl adenosine(37)-C2)-methylthiotransferase MiaB [Patescibacteria group bacterium]